MEVMDCDNDHSDNPADWIYPEDLPEQIGKDVAFAVVPSRNNGKVKDGKAARPRFHVYFPHDPITDSETCAALKRAIQQKFPFFDSHALELPGSSLATPQRKYCGMKARSPSTVWKKPSLEEWLFRSDV